MIKPGYIHVRNPVLFPGVPVESFTKIGTLPRPDSAAARSCLLQYPAAFRNYTSEASYAAVSSIARYLHCFRQGPVRELRTGRYGVRSVCFFL